MTLFILHGVVSAQSVLRVVLALKALVQRRFGSLRFCLGSYEGGYYESGILKA